MIHKFLSKRPLYFGHIFKFAAKKKILPEWVNELIDDAREVTRDWPLKYYPPALEFCPEGWKGLLEERITSNFELMDEAEMSELEAWSQEKVNIEASQQAVFSKLLNKWRKK